MPRRQPAIMIYKGDWLRDPELSMCAPATRGIWFDLLCAMDDAAEQGRITGTLQQLAQVARCTADEMGSALAELAETQTAHVTGCNGDVRKCNSHVTVENRRMRREAEEREKTRLRVAEHRRRKAASGGSNDDVPSSRARSVAVAVAGTTYLSPPPPQLLAPTSGRREAKTRKGREDGNGHAPPPDDAMLRALLAACSVEWPPPKRALSAYRAAVADIRGCGGATEDIPSRARVFRQRWPKASLTPCALARRWAECGLANQRYTVTDWTTGDPVEVDAAGYRAITGHDPE